MLFLQGAEEVLVKIFAIDRYQKMSLVSVHIFLL